MADVTTRKSRTDRRTIFKLGTGVDHLTRHVSRLTKSRNVPAVTRYNSATNSRCGLDVWGIWHVPQDVFLVVIFAVLTRATDVEDDGSVC